MCPTRFLVIPFQAVTKSARSGDRIYDGPRTRHAPVSMERRNLDLLTRSWGASHDHVPDASASFVDAFFLPGRGGLATMLVSRPSTLVHSDAPSIVVVEPYPVSFKKLSREDNMKKYLIAAALILGAPQAVLAQAEAFYLMVDNTTKQCRVMPGSELTSTNKARYKELGKYATIDEAKAAMDSMLGGACPKP